MTKVWVATEGEYSDRRVIAVCATRKIAEAVGTATQSFEVMTSLPTGRLLYSVTQTIERRPHPVNWDPSMVREHFHVGGEDECFACNPGHAQTGICTGCRPTLSPVAEWSHRIYPWDDSYDIAVAKPTVTITGARKPYERYGFAKKVHVGINVQGGRKAAVDAALRKAAATVVVELGSET